MSAHRCPPGCINAPPVSLYRGRHNGAHSGATSPARDGCEGGTGGVGVSQRLADPHVCVPESGMSGQTILLGRIWGRALPLCLSGPR